MAATRKHKANVCDNNMLRMKTLLNREDDFVLNVEQTIIGAISRTTEEEFRVIWKFNGNKYAVLCSAGITFGFGATVSLCTFLDCI